MNRLATTALIASTSLLVACGQADAEGPDAAASPSAHTVPAPVAPEAAPTPQTPPAPQAPVAPPVVPTQNTALTPPPVGENLPQPDTDSFKAARALAGYDKLLRDQVGPLGFVDYDALAADPSFLTAYLDTLTAPGTLPDPDQPDARLATLINAYNAFTLQLILDHYDAPGSGKLKSITDLHGGKPWNQKLWNLAGETISLNQLEHEMIRKGFPAEPRIHWAVVCAAYSCPPLRAEAYTAEQLDAQLADQERRVLLAGDPRFIDTSGAPEAGIRVTQLFNWYGDDFGEWQQYVTKRLELKEAKYDGFIAYDWKLNAKQNRPD